MDLINKDIRVSFDFDDTLSLPSVQKVAKELIEKGFDVIIVTSRKFNEENEDLKDVASDLEIDLTFYTDYSLKFSHLDSLFCDIHIDNNKKELKYISRFSRTKGIDVTEESWETELKNMLCL